MTEQRRQLAREELQRDHGDQGLEQRGYVRQLDEHVRVRSRLLVALLREDNIPAIFSNNTVNPALVEALARETGTDVQVVQLFEGSLGGPDSGADTYASMMTTNARLIADALA